jgi:hypothetical protein
MPTLAEQFTAAEKRKKVVSDLAALVDAEVARKGGLSGLALKASYGVVKAIQPTFILESVDALLDDSLAHVEPIYQECVTAGSAGFTARWNASSGRVADALLAITDGRAARTRHATAKKAYEKLRPTARRNVEEAVPALGLLLLRHAPV